jgi:putative ABC transport system substrate-binding protein
MSYGTNFTVLSRRTAAYVSSVLKGGKPADQHLEQPTRFELVINLKTAKSILMQATKAIDEVPGYFQLCRRFSVLAGLLP